MNSNLKKTLHYFQKNGLVPTYYAIKERLWEKRTQPSYTYDSIPETTLKDQRTEALKWKDTPLFSILVPAYETKPEYLHAMIDSCLQQSYPYFELIIADASATEGVRRVVETYVDERIHYHYLGENKGISENSNRALEQAMGDYIALLDHDDLLTPDALFEMARAIRRQDGVQLLYSDEDKCDGGGIVFYQPHYKDQFNLDLLLSNNYICHFLVMKNTLLKELGFCKEYDGAQDYDLILRAVEKLGAWKGQKLPILHINKVLYHWRCHELSTAENPQSKMYAYEAGKRALEDFLQHSGKKAIVEHSRHLGFYQVVYQTEKKEKSRQINTAIFMNRPDVALIGAKVVDAAGKHVGHITRNGHGLYENLPKGFDGPVHHAAFLQECDSVDIRGFQWNPALEPECMPQKQEELNVLCKQLQDKGYRILWNPQYVVKI